MALPRTPQPCSLSAHVLLHVPGTVAGIVPAMAPQSAKPKESPYRQAIIVLPLVFPCPAPCGLVSAEVVGLHLQGATTGWLQGAGESAGGQQLSPLIRVVKWGSASQSGLCEPLPWEPRAKPPDGLSQGHLFGLPRKDTAPQMALCRAHSLPSWVSQGLPLLTCALARSGLEVHRQEHVLSNKTCQAPRGCLAGQQLNHFFLVSRLLEQSCSTRTEPARLV